MSDFSKCAGNGCNIRESCDRFVRPAVDRQTWLEPTIRTVKVTDDVWVKVCRSRVPLPAPPHGGAVEEGDAC